MVGLWNFRAADEDAATWADVRSYQERIDLAITVLETDVGTGADVLRRECMLERTKPTKKAKK